MTGELRTRAVRRVGVRAAACLLATAALLGGTACSGSSKPAASGGDRGQAFTTSYRRITADLTERSQQIKERTAAVKSGDVGDVLDVYQQIRESSEQAHLQLSQLWAPAPVKGPLARLVGLLAEQTDVLGELITAANAEDKPEVSRALTRLVALTRDFDAARTDMERAIAACGDDCG